MKDMIDDIYRRWVELHNEQEIIGDEFLIGLLDFLEEYNNKATTNAEYKLLYKLVKTLNDNVEFTND
jgi:hypothetical protein